MCLQHSYLARESWSFQPKILHRELSCNWEKDKQLTTTQLILFTLLDTGLQRGNVTCLIDNKSDAQKRRVSRAYFPEQYNQDLKPGKPPTYPCVSLRVVARVPRQWGNLQKELCVGR